MDKIYLRIEGIDGPITRSDRGSGWMQISNVEFEISREIEFKDVTERLLPDHSHPDISKIRIIKPLCPASPSIFQSICLLKKRKFELDLIHDKNDGHGLVDELASTLLNMGVMSYEADICFVNSVHLSAAAGHPAEDILITVPSLKMTYTPSNISQDTTGAKSFGYNFQMSRLI
jgi:type VI protein secretion system component Hcp